MKMHFFKSGALAGRSDGKLRTELSALLLAQSLQLNFLMVLLKETNETFQLQNLKVKYCM